MKICFNGFWDGFISNENPICSKFFIDLFKKVFFCNIEISNIDEAEILCESIFGNSVIDVKKWKYSFLFSGESICPVGDKYTAVLKGSRTHKNIIHCPLFVPYMYCNSIQFPEKIKIVPQKFCCTFISNPSGVIRNKFIEELEKNRKIDHFGTYKNNTGGSFPGDYNSQNLIKKMSEYKFVICFENSEEDAYITEKIINPLLANVIPVYWGNKRIGDYFNIDRILHFKDENDMEKVINIMCNMNDLEYIKIINEDQKDILNVKTNIDIIADDIKRVIRGNKISKIICITNEEKEKNKYDFLKKQFIENSIPSYIVEYSLPTYFDNMDKKLLSTVKINNTDLQKEYNRDLRTNEISLFLNFYIIFKRILGSYKEGIFITYESDIIFKNNIHLLNVLINKLRDFDCIAFGSGCSFEVSNPNLNIDIDIYKMNRTRCTDSFIWTYKGIEKFTLYIEKIIFTTGIDWPIDFFMDNFLKQNNFDMYWTYPSLTIQGSQNGTYKSTVQT
jgi:hypothetical protein